MKLLLLSITLILANICQAQINFVAPETSWEQLSKRAKAEKKLIFIHLEDSKCEQCNEVATQGFSNSLLKEKFENNFVSIRSNVETENGRKLAEKFQIRGALLSLFVDGDGNILNRYNGSTNSAMIYAEHADAALGRRGAKKLLDYDKEYSSGERGGQFLKEYILKRREAKLPANQLLDEYVTSLPVDSLNNFQTIKFIYLQGPSLDSETYKKIRTNTRPTLLDSIYRLSSKNDAIAMNNSIIGSTFRNAVVKKDVQLAHQVAQFTRTSYMPDDNLGTRAFHNTMLNYYHAVKDTVNYMSEVIMFINRYYLNVKIDSLIAMDDLEVKKMMAQRPNFKEGNVTQSFGIAPPSQYFHLELNNQAWRVYEWANSKEMLERALTWSQKSMELFDAVMAHKTQKPSTGNPGYLDTYAHILYKLDRRTEAVEWQTKALEAQRATGMTSNSFESTLNKMKSGTL
ncbi:hypothetical protein [Dyadobacter luticola]|uniref:DUF255 domain-containing protein n=1 Tax=Dyadobacter luticola TaxID=1979387 RepID=A0A5R9L1I2_9BACT|nr:hypothetical protein [Dyadobacter luticola]TLV02268.1 hypothetical protein FEN17_01100 [Dyadobacter luticola]